MGLDVIYLTTINILIKRGNNTLLNYFYLYSLQQLLFTGHSYDKKIYTLYT